MNNVLSKLYVWTGEGMACVRVVGRANFTLSVPFRKVLQHLQSGGHARILLDLSKCQFMDSTFLGILAYEANNLAFKGAGGIEPGLELLNANADVREIIEDLGVAHLVRFSERDLAQAEFKEVPGREPASTTDLNRTCLEAHELLMALHPANVEKFRDVARFFADELKQSSERDAG